MLENQSKVAYNHYMENDRFELFNPKGKAPLILICDHASNYIPCNLKSLGLNNEEISKHIAWDIGAAILTREISRIMDAMAVLNGTSRLVIDANRPPHDVESIPRASDNISISGNHNLRKSDREHRVENFFWPYHNAITLAIDNHRKSYSYPTNVPAIISIHTFTPSLESSKKVSRPWHLGVLWNKDPRMALPFIEILEEHPKQFSIGNNQPYSGKEYYFSLDFHAGTNGLPHFAIEIRQDLVLKETEALYWGKVISETIIKILKMPNIQEIAYY